MFVGREKELAAISAALQNNSASVLVYGKRKVGKTTLIMHALKESSGTTIYYECLKSTMQDNVDSFVAVLVRENVLPVQMKFNSFQDVFIYLNSLNKVFNIVIDEYPYLKQFTKAETVDSIFQSIIDNHICNIRLFLSGSHVGMMKDLLQEKNALYGRFKTTIKLAELNYLEAAEFYTNKSVYDKIALFSIFGGSPFVCSFIDSTLSLKENVINSILNQSNAVYNYADHLLISDFSNSINAERIFYALANGRKKYGEIEGKLKMQNNGLLSKQLKSLLDMDMVIKVNPINKLNDKKKTSYEISDNLLRFYYAYIYSNKSALQMLGAEAFYDTYIEPSIVTFISHRFEEICRTYFSLSVKSGKLKDIYNIGTLYYDDSENKKNGEFDVVLQRNGYYDIYEAKYLTAPLPVKDMEQEAKQVRAIEGISVGTIGFISISGFESTSDKYDCIIGETLYK